MHAHVVNNMTSLIIIDRIDNLVEAIGLVPVKILRLPSVPGVWSNVSRVIQNYLSGPHNGRRESR